MPCQLSWREQIRYSRTSTFRSGVPEHLPSGQVFPNIHLQVKCSRTSTFRSGVPEHPPYVKNHPAQGARVFAQARCACFCCGRPSKTPTGDTMSGVARDAAADAAKRRPDRQYRSFWRHELMAIRMAKATACHHSAQKRSAATHAATHTMAYAAPAPVVKYTQHLHVQTSV